MFASDRLDSSRPRRRTALLSGLIGFLLSSVCAPGCSSPPEPTWPSGSTSSTSGSSRARQNRDYATESRLLDFRDEETDQLYVVGAMRRTGSRGFMLAMASMPGDPSREILVTMRPVGRKLSRCEAMKITSGAYDEEHAIEEVETNGTRVRYRLSVEDVIRIFIGQEQTVRICDREIQVVGTAARVFRRFVILTIIRMEQERPGSAADALRAVGEDIEAFEAPGLQVLRDEESGEWVVRAGARARGMTPVDFIFEGRPATSPDLVIHARGNRFLARPRGCTDFRPAIEADALILRGGVAEPSSEEVPRGFTSSLAWSDFVPVGLAQSVRFEYCREQWRVPAGAVARFERFSLIYLALRSAAWREGLLEFFPSLQLPPAEAGERPEEITDDVAPSESGATPEATEPETPSGRIL